MNGCDWRGGWVVDFVVSAPQNLSIFQLKSPLLGKNNTQILGLRKLTVHDLRKLLRFDKSLLIKSKSILNPGGPPPPPRLFEKTPPPLHFTASKVVSPLKVKTHFPCILLPLQKFQHTRILQNQTY